MLKFVVLFSACLGLSLGFNIASLTQGMHLGNCKPKTLKADFNLDSLEYRSVYTLTGAQLDNPSITFMGTWYENYRSDVFYGGDLKCGRSVMTRSEDGQTPIKVTMSNSATKISSGLEKEKTGVAEVRDMDHPAKWYLEHRAGLMSLNVEYSIIDTDYNNWAIIYSCMQMPGPGGMHYDIIWILTRNAEGVNAAQLEELKAKLNPVVPEGALPNNIDPSRLKLQTQTGCTNY